MINWLGYFIAVTALAHTLMAMWIYRAETRVSRPATMASPRTWALATMAGGVVTLGIYWWTKRSAR